MAFQIPDFSFLLNPNNNTEMPAASYINPPVQDPYVGLNDVLNNLSNQPLPTPPPQSPLQRILQSVAQVASVASAKDPGAELSNQLKQKQEDQDFIRNAIFARQNLINQVRVQAASQQAQDISREQAQVRMENRANQREIAGETRAEARDVRKEFRAYRRTIDLKEADLKFAERERQNTLDFEQKNQGVINALRTSRVMIDALPQQVQDKIKMKSIWMTANPNADPNMLETIANKLTGIDKIGLSPIEKQVLNKINTIISNKENQMFQTEIQLKQAHAKYFETGGGQNLSNLLQKNIITNTANETLKGIAPSYVKIPNPANPAGPPILKSEREMSDIERMQYMNAPRTTDKEALQETQRRIDAVNNSLGEVQQQITNQQKNPISQPVDTGEVMRAMGIVRIQTDKGRTREQIIHVLEASQIPPDVIKNLFPEYQQANPPAPQGTTTTKPGQYQYGPQAQEEQGKTRKEANDRYNNAVKNFPKNFNEKQ